MLLVVADAGPIHYLILIGHADILRALFKNITVPWAVYSELTRAQTPVRAWIQAPPAWLEVQIPPRSALADAGLKRVDEGERAALALAASLGAGLLLMDDCEAVRIARNKGFRVIGTLRIP